MGQLPIQSPGRGGAAKFVSIRVYSWLNSSPGMKEFLEFVIRQLIEYPDEMMLTEIPGGKTTVFKLQLRQSDVGRIIGRNGQTIQAIRALLNSSASRHGQRATLDIVE
jgi:predicted RNA-binding protein YlqC (UPF0109 family)